MIKMIENAEVLFEGEIDSYESLVHSAIGTERTSDLQNILNNKAINGSDPSETYNHNSSEDDFVEEDGDDIFAQMAIADEIA